MRAGFGKVEISERAVGAPMIGYCREGGALSIHDPLYVRALVLEQGGRQVAVCSLDLCGIGADVVAAARERTAREHGLAADDVFVACTHTHSGPRDDDDRVFPDGLAALITRAIGEAQARLREARVGAGWGFLHGHALNRRRFEDPVDPAVFVVRVDDEAGAPLGVLHGFACHPVVLGPDSYDISADWPGVTCDSIETALGGDAVAVFAQGACADVNPLTDEVRARLAAADSVICEVEHITYYGRGEDGRGEDVYEIGDRTGGTFAEAQRLGQAVAQEALRVHSGIAPVDATGVWARRLVLPHPQPQGKLPTSPLGEHFLPRTPAGEPLEVMLLGIDGPGIVLVGQPGEVFVATGVGLRRALRAAGFPHPWVVGYANDWRAYLAPPEAYPDGGYEVDWARAAGHPQTLQDEIRAAVLEAVARDAP
jgi:neutral ceramidase